MLQFTKRKPGVRDTSFSTDKQTVDGNLFLVDQDESELWLKKHRPTTVKDLAMHSSRVPINNNYDCNYHNSISWFDSLCGTGSGNESLWSTDLLVSKGLSWMLAMIMFVGEVNQRLDIEGHSSA